MSLSLEVTTHPFFERDDSFTRDYAFFWIVDFGVGPFMDHIHWDYPLLATFLNIWDSTTSTFHLPIGEMIVTITSIIF